MKKITTAEEFDQYLNLESPEPIITFYDDRREEGNSK